MLHINTIKSTNGNTMLTSLQKINDTTCNTKVKNNTLKKSESGKSGDKSCYGTNLLWKWMS